MFQCGDQVLYGIHGICRIIAVERMKLSGKPAEYFVLEPVGQPNAKYYVPTQNQAAVAKLQPILTREELQEILHSASQDKSIWIDDENKRKQQYSSLITSGDRGALVRAAHAIHKHKLQQEANGKKLHLCDENFLRDAERLLSSEFSMVLNITPEEVGQYIQDIFGHE